ncbi:acyltransferase family protein [Bradyrhizobium sp. USDA 4504]
MVCALSRSCWSSFFTRPGEQFYRADIGVDIFFVLSGYLITSLLISEYRETGEISLSRFYVRRALRLMPALWLTLVLASLAWWLFSGTPPDWPAVSASALYYMNWLRAFTTGQDWILGHTWSLEEQFYLLWPMVLVVVLSVRPSAARWAAAILLVCSIATWPVLLWRDDLYRVYNEFDTRSSEMFIGCLLALLPVSDRISMLLKLLSPVPILALALVSVTLDWRSPILMYGGYPAIAALTAWILIAIQAGAPFNIALRNTVIVYIGRISYGIYLFHFPVGQLITLRGWSTTASVVTVAPISIALAALSYSLMERRFLQLAPQDFSYHWRLMSRRDQLRPDELV